jgi:hypothetical protein
VSHFIQVTAIPQDPDGLRQELLVNTDQVRFIQKHEASGGSVLVFDGVRKEREVMQVAENRLELWLRLQGMGNTLVEP